MMAYWVAGALFLGGAVILYLLAWERLQRSKEIFAAAEHLHQVYMSGLDIGKGVSRQV